MKVSVPLTIGCLNEDSIGKYCSALSGIGATRVFIYGLGSIHLPSSLIYTDPEKCRFVIDSFRKHGIEAGFWVDSLGHGRPLYSCFDYGEENKKYTPIEGVDGRSTPYALCPDDPRFLDDYLKGIRTMASFGPDLIMFDDDFRFSRPSLYTLGCFCPRHTEEFFRRVGERVDKSRLTELIFGGSKKWRNAYFDMLGDTLIRFAKRIRAAIDSVNPKIRAGAASVRESIDFCGTDEVEIAKALAGDTLPFTRTSGAPYGGTDVIECVEFTRLQSSRLKGRGLEYMTEGDTYPRPRYNMSFKVLEMYNEALCADPNTGGRLDYVVDYIQPLEYEPGYVERYGRKKPYFDSIENLFKKRRSTGVYVLDRAHKIRERVFDHTPTVKELGHMHMTSENPASVIISKNSIPTAFAETGYPVSIFGDNARFVDRSVLKYGAILDAVSATILSERGIDTGIVRVERAEAYGERFLNRSDSLSNVDSGGVCIMEVKPEATVHSVFEPSMTPASYTYRNKDGESFLVLGIDSYIARPASNYAFSYYRQRQLIGWIEEQGKALPAVCERNPNLYISAAEDEDTLAILLLNSFPDEMIAEKLTVGCDISSVRMLNDKGELVEYEGEVEGRVISLPRIEPFGSLVLVFNK